MPALLTLSSADVQESDTTQSPFEELKRDSPTEPEASTVEGVSTMHHGTARLESR